jgi:protocatechuate 3,4-dioxygenase beta subunit
MTPDDLARRDVLLRGAALLPAAALLGCGEADDDTAAEPTVATTTARAAQDGSGRLATTAECADDDEPTLAQTEGPYFSPGSPLRRSLLEPGTRGTRLVISGLVLSEDCRPLRRAVLDFWQADARGEYDNEGFTLRGHQRTDADGRYRLETVVPGLYPGRTRHLHVKVARARSSAVLTTQLYFAGEAGNRADGIHDRTLEMRMGRRGRTRTGRFDFVLA